MKKILSVIFLFCIIASCSKKEENSQIAQINTGSTMSIQEQLDNFKPSIKITKITRLDIPTFLTVYISFLEDQIIWLRDNYRVNNNINTESEEDLTQDSQNFLQEQAKQKSDFFQKWGISFNEFDQFSLTHSQEVQDYLKSHSTEQKEIEKLEQFLSSIQTSNPIQNDEYNFKDENTIVEKTLEQEQNSFTTQKEDLTPLNDGIEQETQKSKGES